MNAFFVFYITPCPTSKVMRTKNTVTQQKCLFSRENQIQVTSETPACMKNEFHNPESVDVLWNPGQNLAELGPPPWQWDRL